MKREDLLWLAVKAAGVWLLVVGVENLPAAIVAMIEIEVAWDTGRTAPFVGALIPLLVGGVLLYSDSGRWLPAMSQGFASTPTIAAPTESVSPESYSPGSYSPRAMSREDWLWVGFKLFGAYLVLVSISQLPSAHMALDWMPWVYLGIVCNLALGMWLLLGIQVWRWACAGRPRPAA